MIGRAGDRKDGEVKDRIEVTVFTHRWNHDNDDSCQGYANGGENNSNLLEVVPLRQCPFSCSVQVVKVYGKSSPEQEINNYSHAIHSTACSINLIHTALTNLIVDTVTIGAVD